MGRDNVVDVPPPPVSNEMPLGREVGKDMSTPKSASTAPALESDQKSKTDKSLPNFEIVPNLKELERIENRQNRLGSLTEDIIKSRDRAHKNEALRAAGKIPEGAPSDSVPNDNPALTDKPNTTNKPIEATSESQLTEARERAQKEGKKLFVEVYGPRCGHCTNQENTMKDPEIQALLQNAVVVKVNGDANPDLCRKLKVTGYPTTDILSPGQNRPTRHRGEMSKQELLSELR